jgi:hypothetical protein
VFVNGLDLGTYDNDGLPYRVAFSGDTMKELLFGDYGDYFWENGDLNTVFTYSIDFHSCEEDSFMPDEAFTGRIVEICLSEGLTSIGKKTFEECAPLLPQSNFPRPLKPSGRMRSMDASNLSKWTFPSAKILQPSRPWHSSSASI